MFLPKKAATEVDVKARLFFLGGGALVKAVYLSILCEMMVQQLGVRLLVWWQDMKEGGRSITRSTARVQGPRPSQRRRKAKRRRGPCVEALLVK